MDSGSPKKYDITTTVLWSFLQWPPRTVCTPMHSLSVLTQFSYCLIMIKTNNNKIQKRQKRAITISVKFELDIQYACVCVCVCVCLPSISIVRNSQIKCHLPILRLHSCRMIRWEIILMCFQFLDSRTRRRSACEKCKTKVQLTIPTRKIDAHFQ